MSWLYLWFNPCAFYYRTFAHGTAGAVGARLSLRPLIGREQTKMHDPGESEPREREAVFSPLSSPRRLAIQYPRNGSD